MQEIIKTLSECADQKCKLKYNNIRMMFTKDKQHGYWIQRLENQYYGLSVLPDGTIIYGYPHLTNIKDDTKFSLQSCYLEKKENGTCIPISIYNGVPNIRTRMNPIPAEFPIPTFWNSTINQITDDKLRAKISQLRDEMLSKYPWWYLFEADGEYVGLKIQEVVNSILDVEHITSYNNDYVFYFELVGKINPIIIDSEMKYGLYDYDYDVILFDIMNKKTHTFLDRKEKERIAEILGIKLVSLRFTFDDIKSLKKSIPFIKSNADVYLSEGFVLKNGKEIIKVKSDVVLQNAYRLNAMMRGYIDINDMYNYIGKTVSAEYLKRPDEFDNLVELVQIEAMSDYPEEIVNKQKNQIQKYIAYQMAIFVADKIVSEQTFETPDTLYRYLNLEIPKRFTPLKSYIDFDKEKFIEDKITRKRVKRIRTNLFSVVSKYCMKKLNIGRGGYEHTL